MKRLLLYIILLVAFAPMKAETVSGENVVPKPRATYLWVVDVSGTSNIYLDEIQPAIDSFYVAATRYDNLNVMRYAASVIDDSTVLDRSFYEYSDQHAMLTAVDNMIGCSPDSVVRVYILSDFINKTWLSGATRLTTDTLLTFRQHLMSYSDKGKDIKLTMLILPPSTSPGGYSLDSIRAVIPEGMYEQFPVMSADSLIAFIHSETDSLHRQLWYGNAPVETDDDNQTLWLILCGVALAVLLGLGGWYQFVRRRK